MLTGKTIQLRALEPEDLSALYAWENNTNVWQVSNTLTPVSRHALEQYIQNSQYDIYTTKQLRLVIETNSKKPIGCIDLFDFDVNNKRAGIGILIAEEVERNKGFATEALEILIKYSFTTLGLHQLYCNIMADNESSLSLFKKFGFQVIGLKKQWVRTGNSWANEYMLQLINE